MTAIPLSSIACSNSWQADFLKVLPAIKTHAAICFRRLEAEAREEARAASVARAFVDFGRLANSGRLSQAYVSTLADYTVRAVRGHKHVGGHRNSRDVMSPLAQQRHGFMVRSLSTNLREMLADERHVSPADQAVFNVDFQCWMDQWSQRHRAIIEALGSGESTGEVAGRFKLTEGRISQLRRDYERSWCKFQGMELEMPDVSRKVVLAKQAA